LLIKIAKHVIATIVLVKTNASMGALHHVEKRLSNVMLCQYAGGVRVIEVFGLSIDGQTMYSTDPKVIAVEALAYMGVEMNFTEALKSYEHCYGYDSRGFDRRQELSESGDFAEFYRKFGAFKTAIMRTRWSQRQYKEFPEMQFVKKEMTEREFYQLSEFQ